MKLRSLLHRFRSRLKLGPKADLQETQVRPNFAQMFERRELDFEDMARKATTRFEQVYYRHRGRVIFKWDHYLKTYDLILAPFVGKPITLVEIGLAGGGSLDLWREYLGDQIKIIGIDCEPGCTAFESENVQILIGDQGDHHFLENVAKIVGTADIIIDDGSHISAHQILSFEKLFPILSEGGLYVCEDLHTSYWPEYNGGLRKEGTFIEYVKTLLDKLHHFWGVGELAEDDAAQSIERMVVTDSLIAFSKAKRRQPFLAWVGSD